ncbi:PaaX family transcriptional regulator C-terminal domain-containing protein [Microbacterium sp.]|uniref:PaaX family transcriptional regulator n=1 Tax=Microbacterium sp. TaxID=51671 RepID=UPI0028A0F5F5|nr:PaaX family transcriptional regulator C-terminal domain-containing protein [Microbacterium sp.]
MTAERSGSVTDAEGTVLDDIDARPGSTASLLRTLIGLYLRPLGGWISAADLVALAGDLGIPTAQARTGITRLKQKGLLLAERRHAVGYRVNPDAVTMLERGDRRIFEMREMTDADSWCLISFSIPESARSIRHQLRRRLQFIGAGVVSPALWICPGHLQDEVVDIVTELDARAWVTLFRAGAPTTSRTLPEAASEWWDLDALRDEHLAFQRSLTALPDEPFAAYVRLIDSWRVLPYIDPGLPPSMLPADWPGGRSYAEFARLSTTLADAAWQHVRELTGAVTAEAARS